jgi:hypothetical protein
MSPKKPSNRPGGPPSPILGQRVLQNSNRDVCPNYANLAIERNKVIQGKGNHEGRGEARPSTTEHTHGNVLAINLSPSFLQRTYIFTFLLSSRVFMPPHDLLARVGQICLEQRQQLEAGPEKVSR